MDLHNVRLVSRFDCVDPGVARLLGDTGLSPAELGEDTPQLC